MHPAEQNTNHPSFSETDTETEKHPAQINSGITV